MADCPAFYRDRSSHNTEEIIAVSCDLQIGSYIDLMRDPARSESQNARSSGVGKKICHPGTLLEARIGETTTLCGVLKPLGSIVENYGFDISCSPAYASNLPTTHAICSERVGSACWLLNHLYWHPADCIGAFVGWSYVLPHFHGRCITPTISEAAKGQ